MIEAILGANFGFKVKADTNIEPEEYFKYFEDSMFVPNAEIEPKGVPKMASS